MERHFMKNEVTNYNMQEQLPLQPLRINSPGATSPRSPRLKRKGSKPQSLYEHAIMNNATTGVVLAQTVSPTDLQKLRTTARSSKESFIAMLRRAERVKNNLLWGTLYNAWDFLTS
jgi:hypothetical protein